MNTLFFALIALIWGGVWLPIKIAISVFPPFTTAALRLALTVALAGLAMFMLRRPKVSAQTWRNGLILGVIGMGIPWILLFWGQQHIYPGLSSIINSTVPLFVVLYSWLIFNDATETGKRKLFGVICGFIGILVIFSPQLTQLIARHEVISSYELWGMLALVGMAACYGLHIVLLKRYSLSVDPNTSLLIQGLSALALLSCMAWFFESDKFPTQDTPNYSTAVICIVYMAVIGSFAGLNLFFRLIKRVGAVKAGTVTYLIPIISILIDWAYYHKWPTKLHIIGALLIFLGLAIVHLLPSSKKTVALEKVSQAA